MALRLLDDVGKESFECANHLRDRAALEQITGVLDPTGAAVGGLLKI